MHKLPVMEVVRRSYQFLVSDLGTIIRLSWAPLLVVAIIQYLLSRQSLMEMIAAERGDGSTVFVNDTPQWQGIVAALISVIASAIVAVALHRVVLFGERRSGTFVHIAFGKEELLFTILPIVILIVLGIAAAAVVPPIYSAVSGSRSEIPLLSVLVVVVALVFISVRFSLLWPLIVIEQRYMFRDAWDLSQGNFWRLFGALVLCLLPFMVVTIVVVSLFPVIAFGGLTPFSTQAENVSALNSFADLLIVQSVINYVITILISGIAVAALSYAYKALRGYGPDDIVAQ